MANLFHKFFLESGDKNLPGSIHLQRRADFLLKNLLDIEGEKYGIRTEISSKQKKPIQTGLPQKRPISRPVNEQKKPIKTGLPELRRSR